MTVKHKSAEEIFWNRKCNIFIKSDKYNNVLCHFPKLEHIAHYQAKNNTVKTNFCDHAHTQNWLRSSADSMANGPTQSWHQIQPQNTQYTAVQIGWIHYRGEHCQTTASRPSNIKLWPGLVGQHGRICFVAADIMHPGSFCRFDHEPMNSHSWKQKAATDSTCRINKLGS